MTVPIDISQSVVEQIVARVQGVDNEKVAAVLAAWQSIREGDPIGTVRRCPDTGGIAHRVSVEGVHMWRVSMPDGSQHNDLQPTLRWPIVGG